MKQLFYIDHDVARDAGDKLSIQAGGNYFAFAITDESGSILKQLAYGVKEQRTIEWSESELNAIRESYPGLKKYFNKVNVSYNSSEAVLIPHNQTGSSVINDIFFDSGWNAEIINETIMNGDLNNQYPVPKPVSKFINVHFPGACYHHAYSLLLNKGDKTALKECLLVDFRHEEFTVVAMKESVAVLAQTIPYSVSADVLYFLLKLCHHAGFTQETVHLLFSGLLDRKSGLFNELYQYFTNISLRESGWDLNSLYPTHFFTTLNDLATCES